MIFLFAEMFLWTCTYLKLSVTSALCTLSQFIVARIMSLLYNLIYQFTIFCSIQPPHSKPSAWLHANHSVSEQLWLLPISNCLRFVTTEVTECSKDYLYSSANFKCFAVFLSMQRYDRYLVATDKMSCLFTSDFLQPGCKGSGKYLPETFAYFPGYDFNDVIFISVWNTL